MMDFLRGLSGPGLYKSGSMEGGIMQQTGTKLDRKMKIDPPPPVEQLLPAIPPLVPLANIKSSLKKIINQAFQNQQKIDLREIVNS